MIIYKATNKVTKKVYIGKSKGVGRSHSATLHRRMRQHKHNALTRNSPTIFAKTIRSYGWDAFTWEIIDTGLNNEELIEKEKYWVRHYQSNHRDYGYNQTEGGDGKDGYKASPELRKKLSEAHKGVKLSAEHRRMIGESQKGKVVTEETKKKIRDKQKGIPRQTAGENHPLSKLTEADVVEIKQLLMKGESQRRIAKQFGVTRGVITYIQKGQTWATFNKTSCILLILPFLIHCDELV